jgi:hypothetical protein
MLNVITCLLPIDRLIRWLRQERGEKVCKQEAQENGLSRRLFRPNNDVVEQALPILLPSIMALEKGDRILIF